MQRVLSMRELGAREQGISFGHIHNALLPLRIWEINKWVSRPPFSVVEVISDRNIWVNIFCQFHFRIVHWVANNEAGVQLKKIFFSQQKSEEDTKPFSYTLSLNQRTFIIRANSTHRQLVMVVVVNMISGGYLLHRLFLNSISCYCPPNPVVSWLVGCEERFCGKSRRFTEINIAVQASGPPIQRPRVISGWNLHQNLKSTPNSETYTKIWKLHQIQKPTPNLKTTPNSETYTKIWNLHQIQKSTPTVSILVLYYVFSMLFHIPAFRLYSFTAIFRKKDLRICFTFQQQPNNVH